MPILDQIDTKQLDLPYYIFKKNISSLTIQSPSQQLYSKLYQKKANTKPISLLVTQFIFSICFNALFTLKLILHIPNYKF